MMNSHRRHANNINNEDHHDFDSNDLSTNSNQFTDEEIREQLNCLGFKNIPQDKFKQFKNGETELYKNIWTTLSFFFLFF